MKLFLCSLCILAGLTAAWAASGTGPMPHHTRPVAGALDSVWAPDAFGYTARDNVAPGGPTFQWFDISTTGTLVTGLGDDNAVGPFAIGWNFHYYWYDVNQFWIGSNGHINFDTEVHLAATFPQFAQATSTTPPNNVIGAYCADWDFSGDANPATCHYWTNNTDTLIVSWTNVLAWAQDGSVGNHNFQMILSGVDSSITFMYGVSTTGDVGSNISIGFENLSGMLGLSINYNEPTLDVNQYPANNSAVKIYYPDEVTYTVHDLAMAAVHNTRSGGVFLRTGTLFTPWMQIRNAGNQDEPSYNVNYVLRRQNNSVALLRDTTQSAITAGSVVALAYPDVWVVDTTYGLRAVATVTRPGDMVAANNQTVAEVHALTVGSQAVELAYDDGAADDEWSWSGGDGGMANEFVPPVYPAEITHLRFYILYNGDNNGYSAHIYDNDGPGGSPGTELWTTTVANPASADWSEIDVPAGAVTITSGLFYVAWMQMGDTIRFGLDADAPPFSRRAWEYTGSWSTSRRAPNSDLMIRCSVRDLEPAPLPYRRMQPADSSTQDLNTSNVVHFAWRQTTDPDDSPVSYLVKLWVPSLGFSDQIAVAAPDTAVDYNWPIPTVPTLDEIFWAFWNVAAISGTDTTWAFGPGRFRIDYPTAVETPAGALVITDYALSAYPNPFNPTTRIGYDLPDAGTVELKVFNLMGEVVATLVSGRHEAGRFSATWDGAQAPSGTYFAVLRTPNATRVQKLLLLK